LVAHDCPVVVVVAVAAAAAARHRPWLPKEHATREASGDVLAIVDMARAEKMTRVGTVRAGILPGGMGRKSLV
jgi:hypothetical protein